MSYNNQTDIHIGIMRCLRYALVPNQLALCGPKNQNDILDYKSRLESGKKTLPGLEYLLSKFETLYPYLRLIAKENGIKDPFDTRVVDAYWLGNGLLYKVRKSFYYKFLEDKLSKRAEARKNINSIFRIHSKKILPNHNFHVAQVYREGGRAQGMSVVNILEHCRISAGKVVAYGNGGISVEKREIFVDNLDGRLKLSALKKKTIPTSWQDTALLANIRVGNHVSIHWGFPCEKISAKQAENLEKLTADAIGIE